MSSVVSPTPSTSSQQSNNIPIEGTSVTIEDISGIEEETYQTRLQELRETRKNVDALKDFLTQ